jgi:hypothetical protein
MQHGVIDPLQPPVLSVAAPPIERVHEVRLLAASLVRDSGLGARRRNRFAEGLGPRSPPGIFKILHPVRVGLERLAGTGCRSEELRRSADTQLRSRC